MPWIIFLLIPSLVWGWGYANHARMGSQSAKLVEPATLQAIKQLYPNHSLAKISLLLDQLRTFDASFSQYHFVTDESVFLNHIHCAIHMLIDTHYTPLEKQWALAILVHLIQDMHQPLHVKHQQDFGGNTIWTNRNQSLHQYWDRIKTPPFKTPEQFQQPFASWLEQSQSFHPLIFPKQPTSIFTISPTYHQLATKIAHQQMSLAVYRLAWILDLTFSSQPSWLIQLTGNQPYHCMPVSPEFCKLLNKNEKILGYKKT
jgi:hypothetical protein